MVNQTQSSIFTRTKQDQVLTQKLGYEWKNIYRQLAVIDPQATGLVTIDQFEQTCFKNKVSVSNQELKKLMKTYGDQDNEKINYKQLSISLGLHKESYNYL